MRLITFCGINHFSDGKRIGKTRAVLHARESYDVCVKMIAPMFIEQVPPYFRVKELNALNGGGNYVSFRFLLTILELKEIRSKVEE